MSRSKYKNYYIKYDIFLKLKKDKKTKILDKSLTILPHHLNKFIKVCNGKNVVTLKIHKKMIGYKFGEFLYTRKKFLYKKK